MDPITASVLVGAGSSLVGGLLNKLFGGGGGSAPKQPATPLPGAGFNAPVPQQTPAPQLSSPQQTAPVNIDAVLQRYLGDKSAYTFTPQDVEELRLTGYPNF